MVLIESYLINVKVWYVVPVAADLSDEVGTQVYRIIGTT